MTTPWLSTPQLATWVRTVAVMELLPAALDAQMRRESAMTSFEYQVLAMLSEATDRTLRMTALAAQTNSTLPRLSHVVKRLEDRGLVERSRCPSDGRATNASLTDDGVRAVEAAAPGHVRAVREYVVDALTEEQMTQLGEITDAILGRIDPDGKMTSLYHRHDS
ncbi:MULTISPECIES: MarR family transcriptional regulator [Janibacter]|jgi:DNA-binding MarR family transcriptional regulator|uniref:MarR family transcriptional regulator n=1 Tax=Janibacter melonis TaxID=262209 RepID=A0A176QGB6_9MICO|nr:MarR family transcriptional regulator [Janibacter melonis]MBD5831287.1 MarR family transcriptional regulator [Janibacter melonis]MCB5991888.1 MarR family transcriptional regulator [Janibacter melonis]MCM3555528.1 MarR family transcriptional regulator [Janibacter melonis]OAB88753.1 MarR family transcriptional regulator [Janibacter melonis]QGX08577.1 MarR family transcriptional regulator [Janibacter melonis]